MTFGGIKFRAESSAGKCQAEKNFFRFAFLLRERVFWWKLDLIPQFSPSRRESVHSRKGTPRPTAKQSFSTGFKGSTMESVTKVMCTVEPCQLGFLYFETPNKWKCLHSAWNFFLHQLSHRNLDIPIVAVFCGLVGSKLFRQHFNYGPAWICH